MMHFHLLTALLLFFLAQLHAAEPLRAAETGPEGHELLRDPAFRKGLTQGNANTLPANERADCLARWKAKGINEAQWAFWEICSEGQNRRIPEAHPWLGLDQFGDSVYFSGSQPPLQAGTWVHYDIDVKQLIRESLAATTKEARVRGLAKTYRPEDHFITLMLIGWEVWGGFDMDVEFKNLSLLGWPDPGPLIPDPQNKRNNS